MNCTLLKSIPCYGGIISSQDYWIPNKEQWNTLASQFGQELSESVELVMLSYEDHFQNKNTASLSFFNWVLLWTTGRLMSTHSIAKFMVCFCALITIFLWIKKHEKCEHHTLVEKGGKRLNSHDNPL